MTTYDQTQIHHEILAAACRLDTREETQPGDATHTSHPAQGELPPDTAQSAVMVWREVISGRWSIAEHFDDGRHRCFLAKQSDPAAPGLSERERQIVTLASRGHSNKLIAYELGVSSSTVAAHLTSAARKLGISSREVLLHASAVLGSAADSPSPRRDPDPMVRISRLERDGQSYALIRIELVPKLPVSLTSAEAEVAALVIAGLSNTSIANRRNTSVRTVANQLRSIYAKLSLGSRRQLCSRFSVEHGLDANRNAEAATP